MNRTLYQYLFAGSWLAVGMLAGAVIGILYPLSGREGVFVGALLVGMLFIFILTRPPASPARIRPVPVLPAGEKVLLAPGSQPARSPHKTATVATPDRLLQPDEARKWLDDLLVRQQRS